MYNIAVAMSSTSKSHLTMMRAYHALSEAFAGARYLACFCLQKLTPLEQQLLVRLLWVLFAASCTAHLFGKIPIGLFSPEEVKKFPVPLTLTDRQLAPGFYAAPKPEPSTWHGDDTSYIPGLNSLSELYLVWQSAHSLSTTCDPAAHIDVHMAKIESIMNDLPPELRWRGGLSRPSTANDGHDTQVANLFITSLHIRSTLIRQFGSKDARHEQCEVILSDLCQILSYLPDATFNANGSSLIPKVRDIAAAYLEQADVQGSQIDTACRGNEKLRMVFRRLDDLDCWNNILFIAHP